MRAITGAVLSSKPCSLAKAARILALFADTAASYIPSDAATYLRTAADATNDHHLFRRDLRRYHHGADGTDVALPADGSAAADSKSSKKKKKERQEDDDGSARHRSPEIASDKKSNHSYKATHVKHEVQEVPLGPPDTDFLPGKPIGHQSHNNRKKQQQHEDHEDNVKQQMVVHDLASEQGIPSLGKNKRNNKKRPQEEVVRKDDKGTTVIAVDSGTSAAEQGVTSENKRKKKRGRGDDNENNQEQVVEHTRKKSRSQS
ncbi:hypothetical protein ABZP36_025460 [Zizania latifolia]